MQLNASEEIAKYIHLEMGKTNNDSGGHNELQSLLEKLPVLLMYNLDKERLEEVLRKKLIIRLLDQAKFNAKNELELSEALRKYYGGKFNHRL